MASSRVPLPFRCPQSKRFALFPLEDEASWRLYKQHFASLWTAEELDLAHDRFDLLTDGEQHFLKSTLAFFAWGDIVVNENLLSRFSVEVELPEMRAFYCFQAAMENVHSETYNLLIDHYVHGAERDALRNAIVAWPASERKAAWMMTYLRSDAPFAERLVAFACVEGIFFSGAFCSIFYFKKRADLQMPGLTFSNELISRDEGLHCDFAVHLHSLLWEHGTDVAAAQLDTALRRRDEHPDNAVLDPTVVVGTHDATAVRRGVDAAYPHAGALFLDTAARDVEASFACSAARVAQIVRDAVAVEHEYVTSALPVSLIGINADSMRDYVCFVADRLLVALGFPKEYGVANPFDWMELISLQGKTNFFERRVGEYQKSGVMTGGEDRAFCTDAEF